MKIPVLATHKRVVGFSPPPMPPGIQPQEFRCPCMMRNLIAPHHNAQRPLHTLQVPNFDMNWMAPAYQAVIKPYQGTVCSPPAQLKA